jgi:hypothetical protein
VAKFIITVKREPVKTPPFPKGRPGGGFWVQRPCMRERVVPSSKGISEGMILKKVIIRA